MRRTSAASSFSVGFVLFVALLLVMLAFFWVGSGNGVLSERVTFHSFLPSTSGLAPGSEVRLSGVPVGSVQSIDFSDRLDVSKVRVSIAVREDVAQRIREDSRLWLGTEGLLGDYTVHVSMGTAKSDALPPGGQIPYEERSLLEEVTGPEFTGNTAMLMQAMIELLRQIQEGEGTLGQLVTNPDLYANLNSLIGSVEDVGREIRGITGEVRQLMEETRSERGLLGRLLFSEEYEQRVRVAAESAERVLGELEQVVSGLQEGRGVLGRLVRDEELGDSFVRLVERLEGGSRSLDSILARLEEGEGSAGMFLHDPSLYASMRNVFLGVQDMAYVRHLVAEAESMGQEIAAARRSRIAPGAEAGAVPAVVRGEDGGAGEPSSAAGRDEAGAEGPAAGAGRTDEEPDG